jgi:hypothetical protein
MPREDALSCPRVAPGSRFGDGNTAPSPTSTAYFPIRFNTARLIVSTPVRTNEWPAEVIFCGFGAEDARLYIAELSRTS